MAVLGTGGRLRLRREGPDPVVLTVQDLNAAISTLQVAEPGFWSGDEVTLTAAGGLPVDLSAGTGPDAPDGYASYRGSAWVLGSNRVHIRSNNDPFYRVENAAGFYVTAAQVGQTTAVTLFMYRDQLDRVSFYRTRAEALEGSLTKRVVLYSVDFGSLTLAPWDASQHPDTYGWVMQADLREWVLNLNAPEVDTTSVGEKFGESVKSLVTGGGTMDFLIDRTRFDGLAQDTTALLRLLLLTGKGCRAEAEFWMLQEGLDPSCDRLPGGLFYETELMVTSVAINTRPTDMLAGSLNFVTVGEIALREGTN